MSKRKLAFDLLDLLVGCGFMISGTISKDWYLFGIGIIIINLTTNTGGYKE